MNTATTIETNDYAELRDATRSVRRAFAGLDDPGEARLVITVGPELSIELDETDDVAARRIHRVFAAQLRANAGVGTTRAGVADPATGASARRLRDAVRSRPRPPLPRAS